MRLMNESSVVAQSVANREPGGGRGVEGDGVDPPASTSRYSSSTRSRSALSVSAREVDQPREAVHHRAAYGSSQSP